MRPALLLIDTDGQRRRDVSRGLSAHGYEVVPARDGSEGHRFAAALAPQVIVVTQQLFAGGGPSQEPLQAELRWLCQQGSRVVILLHDAAAAVGIEDDYSAISVAGLDNAELTLRLRLVLVGQEVGVEPDLELRSLVGELALSPFLEVVRSLHSCHFSGRFEIDGVGAVAFEDGQVSAAAGHRVRGLKAFCRLARWLDGAFHLRLGAPGMARNLDLEVPELVLRALEETQLTWPDPHLEIVVEKPSRVIATSASHQDVLVQLIGRCHTVGELIDAWPTTDGRVVQALESLVEKGAVRLQKPHVGVRVITDSTSDLPPQLARAHGIVVVPLYILFGDQRLRDGVDIGPRDFYELLTTSNVHPSTEPPAEAEIYEHFYDEIQRQDILAVHLSSQLSETFERSRRAALKGSRTFDHLPPERLGMALEVVDSRNVSMGTGLQALFAARMSRRGLNVFAIHQRLQKMQPRITTLFVVDTLEYLVRGGRIGKARAWVGKLLGIKPILGVVDGVVTTVDKARGGRQAQLKIVEALAQRMVDERPLVMVVAHARAPVEADLLSQLISQRFNIGEKIVTDIGPVVGTHAGPGCVGCVVFQPDAEEWELIAPLEE